MKSKFNKLKFTKYKQIFKTNKLQLKLYQPKKNINVVTKLTLGYSFLIFVIISLLGTMLYTYTKYNDLTSKSHVSTKIANNLLYTDISERSTLRWGVDSDFYNNYNYINSAKKEAQKYNNKSHNIESIISKIDKYDSLSLTINTLSKDKSTLSEKLYSNSESSLSVIKKLVSVLELQYDSLVESNSFSDTDITKKLQNIETANNMYNEFLQARVYEGNFMITHDKSYVTKIKESINNIRTLNVDLREVFKDSKINSGQVKVINDFLDKYEDSIDKLTLTLESLSQAEKELTSLTDETINATNNLFIQNQKEFNRTSNIFLYISITLFILAIIVTVIGSLIINYSVKKPLSLLNSELITATDNKDLTKQINIKSNDEFHSLSNCFNSFISNIHGIIENIISISHSMFETSDNVNEKVFELNNDIEGISSEVEHLSDSLNSSNEATSNINNLSRGIYDIVESVSELAQNEATNADDSHKTAKIIEGKVESSKIKTQNIYQTTRTELKKSIEDVAVVKNIRVLSQKITEISDETNLLALNATIEAACAGEHGKGFAAVAASVRKLSEDTKVTIKEIREVTDAVIKAVDNLAEHSHHILDFIDKDLINTYALLDEINQKYILDSKRNKDCFSDFENKMHIVFESVHNIVNKIDYISNSIDENTKGLEIISQKVKHIKNVSNTVSSASNSVNKTAGTLQSISRSFIV